MGMTAPNLHSEAVSDVLAIKRFERAVQARARCRGHSPLGPSSFGPPSGCGSAPSSMMRPKGGSSICFQLISVIRPTRPHRVRLVTFAARQCSVWLNRALPTLLRSIKMIRKGAAGLRR